MGSIYPRGSKLWLKYKDAAGEWKPMPTGYPDNEEGRARARADLDAIELSIAAGEEYRDEGEIEATVRSYGKRWLEERRGYGLRSVDNDESRLRLHVYPAIGDMPIRKVRPPVLAKMFKALRKSGALVPKTIHNINGTVSALFRDAEIAGLVSDNPCIMTVHQLGRIVERDTIDAADSIYPREHIELLIGSPLVDQDRRVLYALEYFGRCRQGEAVSVCWRHHRPELEPLGRLTIARSHDHDTTKSGRIRHMPEHPVLAAVLAEWRLAWPSVYGRQPTANDLIVPYIRKHGVQGHQLDTGAMRTPSAVYKAFIRDLAALGLPHRRGHDIGASFITHAEEDGADRDRLNKCTHTGGRRGLGAFERYLRQNWPTLSGEVMKLKIGPRKGADVVAMRAAGAAQAPGNTNPPGTVLVQQTATKRIRSASTMEAWGIERHASLPGGSGGFRRTPSVNAVVPGEFGALAGATSAAEFGVGGAAVPNVPSADCDECVALRTTLEAAVLDEDGPGRRRARECLEEHHAAVHVTPRR